MGYLILGCDGLGARTRPEILPPPSSLPPSVGLAHGAAAQGLCFSQKDVKFYQKHNKLTSTNRNSAVCKERYEINKTCRSRARMP